MIPKLRFPEFTDNWTVTELGECSDIQTGKALPSSDILEFGDRLICRGINVKSGFLESNSEINRFTNSFIDRKYLVQNGDILLPMDGSKVGKNIAVADLEFHNSFLIQRVTRIRLPKELVWFYFQQLWSWNFERYIFTINTSSGIPHISEKQIRRFKVSKPSLEEARKISSLFELINLKINLLTKKKEALETYKKGLMQKIFSQGFRFKREDGTDYPDWEWIALEDILDYEQPTKYIVSSTEYDDSYNTPVLTAGKTFVLGYTNEANGIFSQTPIILFDDFTTDFKFVNFPFKVKSSAAKILKLKRSADMLYVHEAMHTIKFPRGEHKRYWISEFSKMEIPFPTLDEQIKFSALIQSTNAMLEVNEKLLRSSSRLKKGLLQQMFV